MEEWYSHNSYYNGFGHLANGMVLYLDVCSETINKILI
jgi:hypothetical protein